jgi:hypothetical protein
MVPSCLQGEILTMKNGVCGWLLRRGLVGDLRAAGLVWLAIFACGVHALGWCGRAVLADDNATEPKPRLLMVIAEKEYDTRRTLPAFTEAYLGDRYEIDTVTAPDEEGRNNLAGLEKAEGYDLILLSVRRRAPTTQQLSALRRYVDAGGPLVVIRTSCHAFSLRGDEPPAGHAVWDHFDTEVLGCHYANHHPNDVVTQVSRAHVASAEDALLDGVLLPFESRGSLYLVNPLEATTNLLLLGAIEGAAAEPVAWTTHGPGGGRVFATTLGHVSDFETAAFCRLLANGISWAGGK